MRALGGMSGCELPAARIRAVPDLPILMITRLCHAQACRRGHQEQARSIITGETLCA